MNAAPKTHNECIREAMVEGLGAHRAGRISEAANAADRIRELQRMESSDALDYLCTTYRDLWVMLQGKDAQALELFLRVYPDRGRR